MSINLRRAAVFAALVLPLGAFAQETIVKIGHVAPTSGSIAHRSAAMKTTSSLQVILTAAGDHQQ